MQKLAMLSLCFRFSNTGFRHIFLNPRIPTAPKQIRVVVMVAGAEEFNRYLRFRRRFDIVQVCIV